MVYLIMFFIGSLLRLFIISGLFGWISRKIFGRNKFWVDDLLAYAVSIPLAAWGYAEETGDFVSMIPAAALADLLPVLVLLLIDWRRSVRGKAK